MTDRELYRSDTYVIPGSLNEDDERNTPLKLTRRGRIVRTVAALAVAPAVLATGGKGVEAFGDKIAPQIECTGEQDVTAQPGDSLWSIASREITRTEEVPTRLMANEIAARNPGAADGVQQSESLTVPKECERS